MMQTTTSRMAMVKLPFRIPVTPIGKLKTVTPAYRATRPEEQASQPSRTLTIGEMIQGMAIKGFITTGTPNISGSEMPKKAGAMEILPTVLS